MIPAFRPHLACFQLGAILILSAALHAAPPKEALLIANGKYSHFAGLAHPPSDAEKLQAALEQLGSIQFRVCPCANGEGVPKSAAEAVKWYRKAAEQRNAEARKLITVTLRAWRRCAEKYR